MRLHCEKYTRTNTKATISRFSHFIFLPVLRSRATLVLRFSSILSVIRCLYTEKWEFAQKLSQTLQNIRCIRAYGMRVEETIAWSAHTHAKIHSDGRCRSFGVTCTCLQNDLLTKLLLLQLKLPYRQWNFFFQMR